MNWKLTTTLAALGLTLGCNTHKGAYPPVTEPQAAYENTQTIVLLGKGLSEKIAVEGQMAKWSDDGRLQVFANIRNRIQKRLVVQVQTVFKDENGFPVGDETAWQTVVITELSQYAYQSIAQNSKARKYTIRVRKER